tara:strand:+ start:13284 stop:13412 length:129 start_codon:yes stop_codon:yes gene_type:complete
MEFIKQHGLMILAFGMLGSYIGHMYEAKSMELEKCLDKQEAR